MSSAFATKLGKIPISEDTPGIDPRTIFVLAAALFTADSAWHWWHLQRDIRTTETNRVPGFSELDVYVRRKGFLNSGIALP